MKKCEDDGDLVVRLVEMEGRAGEVTLDFPFPIRKAEHTNLIEEEGKPLPCGKRFLKVHLGPRSIETFKITSASGILFSGPGSRGGRKKGR